jgi:hypothetical protein
MPNAQQFMLTVSEHQTIQPALVGVYMARALVLAWKILLSANIALKSISQIQQFY